MEYLGDGASYADDDWDVVMPPPFVVVRDEESDANVQEDKHRDDVSDHDGWLMVEHRGDDNVSATSLLLVRDEPTHADGDISVVRADVHLGNDEGENPAGVDDQSEQHEVDEEDEEDGGDYQRTCSREYISNGEDEWDLERIVNRRRTKQPQRRFDEDGNAYVDVHEYLCKWKGYDAPTWESRQDVEDVGYVALLDAYDAAHCSGAHNLKEKEAAADTETDGPKRRQHAVVSGTVEQLVTTSLILTTVCRICAKAGLELTRYAHIAFNPFWEMMFLLQWCKGKAYLSPRVAFYSARFAGGAAPVPAEGRPHKTEGRLNIGSAKFLASLPTFTQSTSNRSKTLTPEKAKLFALDRVFVVYLSLAATPEWNHNRTEEDANTVNRKAAKLGAQLEALVAGANPRLFAQPANMGPLNILLPLWVVHCRPLSNYEHQRCPPKWLTPAPPCVPLSTLLGDDANDDSGFNSDDSAKRAAQQGVAKLHREKRPKRVSKPKGSRQSDLRKAFQ
jgi:hypothetical protein